MRKKMLQISVTINDGIQQLRDQKRQVDSMMSELRSVIQFNEEMLEGINQDIADTLRTDEESSSAADGSPTDQLVENRETVICRTCGSDVDCKEIEATLDRLRSLRQEKRSTRSDLVFEIDDLQVEK